MAARKETIIFAAEYDENVASGEFDQTLEIVVASIGLHCFSEFWKEWKKDVRDNKL